MSVGPYNPNVPYSSFSNGSDSGFVDVKSVILVGDVGIGKTSLIHSLLGYSQPTVPELHEYGAEMDCFGRRIKLFIIDVPAEKEFANTRPHSYQFAHTVGLCFSIDDPDSLTNAVTSWHHETMHWVPGKPRKVLIGLKKDTREDPYTIARLRAKNQAPVTYEEAEQVVASLGLFGYAECSSATGEGLLKVFGTCLVSVRRLQD